MWRKLLPYLKNKYILVGAFFVVWIGFFDTNRIVSVMRYRAEFKQVQKEKRYYIEEIEKNTKLLELYQNDKKALEKFAREKYFMKKDNEDVFLIVYED
jgi:cell division protein DivIC